MTIASRLRKLEIDLGTRVCPLCGGRGMHVLSYRANDEPPPTADGCAACGALCHIVIQFRDESLPGRPKVNSGYTLSGPEMGALYG